MTGHTLGTLNELHLGTVIDNDDPDSRGRIKVRLHATGLEAWAGVIVPSAGSGYGVSLLPRLNEQVLLAFVSPDLPMVLGAVWSGSSSIPAQASPVEDRYLIRTPAGITVLLDDQVPKVEIKTPAGHHLTIDDQSGGTVTIQKDDNIIEMSSSGISIKSSFKVSVNASQVDISAGMVRVDAGMSSFSGVVRCDTLISNSVVSASYTPGAGNIW